MLRTGAQNNVAFSIVRSDRVVTVGNSLSIIIEPCEDVEGVVGEETFIVKGSAQQAGNGFSAGGFVIIVFVNL